MEKKIILIVGKSDNDKTTKAKEITGLYNNENVTWIDGYNYNKGFHKNFFYNSCSLNTELVVIDGIKDASHIEHFFADITDGISIEKKCEDPFLIYPNITLICSSKILMNDLPIESLAFNRRVLIINCDNEKRKS